jgi:hypothetical protein
MTFFAYTVTKPLTWFGQRSRWIFWIIAICYAVLITMLNVIVVGYERTQVQLPNTTPSQWYEYLPIAKWLPQSRICSPVELISTSGKDAPKFI